MNSLGANIGETVVNIAVLVKQVRDTNSKIQISGDRVDLSTVKMDISPYDEFAVENALQHKESSGGTVTAITVGPAGADKVLKGVKALGVDNIMRLDCDGYMDSNALQSILAQEISSAAMTLCIVENPQQTQALAQPDPGWQRDSDGDLSQTSQTSHLKVG